VSDSEEFDAASGVPTGAAGFDLGSLFGAANDMLAAQQAAAEEEVIGSAGGGAVQITVTGAGEFTNVRLTADAVDPSDITMLEDLILAALHDAMGQVQQLQSSAMGGLDIGSLGGLLGGLGPADDDTP
jgi:DNA-binding protein YbaB